MVTWSLLPFAVCRLPFAVNSMLNLPNLSIYSICVRPPVQEPVSRRKDPISYRARKAILNDLYLKKKAV